MSPLANDGCSFRQFMLWGDSLSKKTAPFGAMFLEASVGKKTENSRRVPAVKGAYPPSGFQGEIWGSSNDEVTASSSALGSSLT